MRNLKKLKIATIISFLVIVFPGKISFINIMYLLIGIVNSPMNLFYTQNSYLLAVWDFFIILTTIISIFLIFKKNRYTILFSIIVQNIYLGYIFKLPFLKHWDYTLPTFTYLVLSVILIYNLFFSKANVEVKSH